MPEEECLQVEVNGVIAAELLHSTASCGNCDPLAVGSSWLRLITFVANSVVKKEFNLGHDSISVFF